MSWSPGLQPMNRRDYLRLGVTAVAGGTFSNLLRLRQKAAEGNAVAKQKTSCILIWMDGGPSHFETFDPKPEADAEVRGEFSAIATKTPGMFFSQYMQRLAAISDKLCIVRSICHNQNNHGAGNHYMTDRLAHADSGCLRGVCQFSSQSGVGHCARTNDPAWVARVFFDAQHVSLGRFQFSGAALCAVRRGR